MRANRTTFCGRGEFSCRQTVFQLAIATNIDDKQDAYPGSPSLPARTTRRTLTLDYKRSWLAELVLQFLLVCHPLLQNQIAGICHLVSPPALVAIFLSGLHV